MQGESPVLKYSKTELSVNNGYFSKIDWFAGTFAKSYNRKGEKGGHNLYFKKRCYTGKMIYLGIRGGDITKSNEFNLWTQSIGELNEARA